MKILLFHPTLIFLNYLFGGIKSAFMQLFLSIYDSILIHFYMFICQIYLHEAEHALLLYLEILN